MADVTNKYLDLAGLTVYDTQIKSWANSLNQLGIKTILKSADGNSINFYKKPSATLSDTADFSIELGSADVAAQLAALATKVGATWNSTTKQYEISLDSSLEATTVVGAINEVISDFNAFIGEIPSGATATTVIGYIAEAITNAIANLDGSATIATESNGVVTIKGGITEADGVIDNDSSSDITLAKVATTGAAEDVSIADAGSKFEATTVEGALLELANAVGAQNIYVTDDSAGQSDYAKVYKIYQGNGSAASPVEAELKGTINIPKDKVVESGSVVDITYNAGKLYDGATDVTALIVGTGTPTSADAGKYIKLVLQNVTDPLYIAAKALVDIYTGGTNTETTVTISSTNEITVTVNDIAASKITYIAEDQSQSISRESVGAALTRLDGDDTTTGSVAKKAKDAAAAAVAALDGSAAIVSKVAGSGSGTSKEADVTTFTGAVVEADGVIDKDSSTANVIFQSIAGSEITALFA